MEIKRVDGKFYIDDNGSEIGELLYTQINDKVFSIDHTFVDPEYRGQGLGDDLVEAAIAYARQNDEKIVPICPFSKKYMMEHPEVQDIEA